MTLLLLFTGASAGPALPPAPEPFVVEPDFSGGGGYGAVMSDEFFQRYRPKYKPTLRKQKT